MTAVVSIRLVLLLLLLLLESAADVSALNEVLVVLVVTAWSDQDAQEVQIVAHVLDK